MKTLNNLLRIICLFVLLGIAASCTRDDGPNDLDGQWSPDLASGNFTGDWEPGEYTWDFDLVNNKLTITKPEDEELGFLDSGTYDFTLSGKTFTISSMEYWYDLKEKTIYIGKTQEVDGLMMRFTRN